METDNIIADIVFGIIFSCLGYSFIFKREKIVNALISSNRVLWENLGFTPNEKKGIFITNIMIPLMGVVFLIVGVALLYKLIIHFLK